MGDDIARQRQLDTSSLRIGTARRYGGDAAHHEVVSPIPHSAPGRPPGSTDHSARPRRKKTSFSLTEPVSAGAASPRNPAENERLYGSATSSAHLPYPHTSSSTAMSSTPQLDPQHRPRSRSVGDACAGDGATASHQRPYTAEPLTPGGTRRDPSRPWRKKTGVTNTAAVPQPAAPARADHAGDQASHGGGAGGGGGRGGGDGAADLLAASMFTMQVADLAQEATDVYGGAGAGGGSTAVVATAAGGGGGGAGAGVPDVVTRQPVRPAASGERRPSTGPREHTLAQTDI
jgi:hypothetical protein